MSKFSPHLADALRELLERDVTWHWGISRRRRSAISRLCSHQLQYWLYLTPTRRQSSLLMPRHMELELYCSRTDKWREETSRLQVQGPDLGGTEICPDRKGGLGLHLGMQEPLRLLDRSLFPHRNGSQASSSPLQPQDELPLRLQRFRLRLLRYSFSISHVSGKSLAVADTYIGHPQQFQHQLTRNFRETLSLMSPASSATER